MQANQDYRVKTEDQDMMVSLVKKVQWAIKASEDILVNLDIRVHVVFQAKEENPVPLVKMVSASKETLVTKVKKDLTGCLVRLVPRALKVNRLLST